MARSQPVTAHHGEQPRQRISTRTCILSCTCMWGLGGVSRHLITEMSWTDSRAGERLTINRLLFSLNSCLSTSLIKTRGWQRKIKAANETNISARLLQQRRAAVQPLAKGGRYATTHGHVCGRHSLYSTSVYSLSIKTFWKCCRC